MAHEVARLMNTVAKLGSVGKVVSISDVELLFKTSAAANGVARFTCADCAVAVSAVLPVGTKPGRKRSPSAHFRAKVPHAVGCTRVPRVLGRIGPTANTMSARPVRGAAPTVWSDPQATKSVGPPPGGEHTTPSGAGASSVRGVKVTSPGSGSSAGHSYRIERFARACLTFGPTQWRNTALQAPWNPGGTYATAFTILKTAAISGSPTAKQIYVDEIKAVHRFPSGFVLELTDRHRDGSELRIWLQKALASGSGASKGLWASLTAGEVKPGMLVFALGEFSRQQTSPSRPHVHQLPVVEGNMVWIVDTAIVERLLDDF